MHILVTAAALAVLSAPPAFAFRSPAPPVTVPLRGGSHCVPGAVRYLSCTNTHVHSLLRDVQHCANTN